MVYIFLFVLILFVWCFLQVFSCIMENNLSVERRNEVRENMYRNETNEIIEVDAVPMTPRSASQNPIKIIITNDNIV